MATALEYGLIAAGIAVVIITAVQVIGDEKPAPPPTVQQKYAALKFDPKLYEPAAGITCFSAALSDDHQSVDVQFGDKCVASPTASVSAGTYDNLRIGQRVKVKMDTGGNWWARPIGSKAW